MDENFKACFEEFLQFKEYLKIKEELLKLNIQVKRDPVIKETESSSQPDLFEGYRTIVTEQEKTAKKHFITKNILSREEKNEIYKAISLLWSKKGINTPGCVVIPHILDPFYDSDPDLAPLKKLKSLDKVRDWLITYLTANRKQYKKTSPFPTGFLYPLGLLITSTHINDKGLFIELDYISNVVKDKH